MKKNAFTLIELLAVIVIFAIIAIIAVPMLLDIISESKLQSFKRSSELYIKSLELTVSNPKLDDIDLTTCDKVENGKLICGENKYKVEVQGKHPEYMEINLDPTGQIYFAMKNEGYCMIKTETDKNVRYKKIVSNVSNSNKEIKDNMCSLDPHTPEACFEFDTSTGTITKYYKNENNDSTKTVCPKDVVIPKKIDGAEVKVIGKSAFYQSGLTSVEIPNTVTEIGQIAFWQNPIKELVIPEGVKTLGTWAFSYCQIEKLSLPSTLTTISTGAFRGNKLPEEDAYIYKRNNDGSIDYSTIIGYGGELKNIIILSEKNGVKLTVIGKSAFYQNGLTSVEIPNTVTEIGQNAFWQNPIKELVIPEGVKTLGTWAFSYCQIEKLSLPSTLTTISTGAFRGNKLPEEDAYIYKRNDDGSIDYSTIISYGGELKNIIIPSEKNGVKLTVIGKSAFYQNGLTSVEIPNTVTEIGQNAFWGNSIEELIIPEVVNTLGVDAFSNNPLTKITIKNTSDKVSLGTSCFGTFDIKQIKWEPVSE